MFNSHNTIIEKIVKILAPIPLKAYQRLIIVNGKAINIADSAGRQQGDYLYSATITLVRENAEAPVHTSAPGWASVEVQ